MLETRGLYLQAWWPWPTSLRYWGLTQWRDAVDWMAKNNFNYLHYTLYPHEGRHLLFPKHPEARLYPQSFIQSRQHLAREIITHAHQNGIRVTLAVYNAAPVAYYDHHPELKAKGRNRRLCWSREENRVFFEDMIVEVMEAFQPDGVVIRSPEEAVCQCDNCQKVLEWKQLADMFNAALDIVEKTSKGKTVEAATYAFPDAEKFAAEVHPEVIIDSWYGSISDRQEELCKHIATGRKVNFWQCLDFERWNPFHAPMASRVIHNLYQAEEMGISGAVGFVITWPQARINAYALARALEEKHLESHNVYAEYAEKYFQNDDADTVDALLQIDKFISDGNRSSLWSYVLMNEIYREVSATTLASNVMDVEKPLQAYRNLEELATKAFRLLEGTKRGPDEFEDFRFGVGIYCQLAGFRRRMCEVVGMYLELLAQLKSELPARVDIKRIEKLSADILKEINALVGKLDKNPRFAWANYWNAAFEESKLAAERIVNHVRQELIDLGFILDA